MVAIGSCQFLGRVKNKLKVVSSAGPHFVLLRGVVFTIVLIELAGSGRVLGTTERFQRCLAILYKTVQLRNVALRNVASSVRPSVIRT